jgi:hypothetical protein
MSRYSPRALVPTRTPTWADLLLTVFAVAQVSLLTSRVPVSWPAFALGFALFAVVFGPVAASPVGERMNQWADGIDRRGLGLGFLLFGVLVWLGANTLPVSAGLVTSLCSGGVVALAVLVAVQLLTAREVDGWT